MRDDLAARAGEGDHDAFTQLVAGSVGQLYRTARPILGRDDLAEDAVQEALMRAWLGIRSLREAQRFDAWLRRLTVNACYDTERKERARRVVEIPEIDAGGAPGIADHQRRTGRSSRRRRAGDGRGARFQEGKSAATE